MNSQTVRRKVIVTDPQGLHLRPLAAFAQLASKFRSAVHVCKDNNRYDGRSPIQLMLLAAVQGTELTLEASGDDAPEAVEALAELLSSRFSEQEPDQPALPGNSSSEQ